MALEEKIEFGTAGQLITADESFTVPQGLLRYDLACGQTPKDGFKGVDRVPVAGIDIVHDLLEFPWPFKDSSVYEFNCEHFVEHIPLTLPNGDNGLIRFMEEVYRCLMPRGMIRIVAPHYMSCEAWQDPTHCRVITDRTFLYFDRTVMVASKLDHYTGDCDFEQLSRTFTLGPEWEGKADEARNWAMRHYWNVVKEIQFVLRKRVK